MGLNMHVRRAEPSEQRLFSINGALHEIKRVSKELLVDGFHPLAQQWAGVLIGTVPDTLITPLWPNRPRKSGSLG